MNLFDKYSWKNPSNNFWPSNNDIKNVFQLCFDESSFKIKFLSIADAAHARSMKEKWNVTHFIHKLDVYGWLVVHFYLSSLMWDTAQYVWHISSNNWSVLFFHGIFHLLSMLLRKYKWIDRKENEILACQITIIHQVSSQLKKRLRKGEEKGWQNIVVVVAYHISLFISIY